MTTNRYVEPNPVDRFWSKPPIGNGRLCWHGGRRRAQSVSEAVGFTVTLQDFVPGQVSLAKGKPWEMRRKKHEIAGRVADFFETNLVQWGFDSDGTIFIKQMCIYIYIYIPTYLHTYIPTYLHTYIHTYLHTYLPTYIHTYVHTYIHNWH